VLAVIFIFVIVAAVRSFLLKPSDKSEVTAIPEGEYDPAVWGRYYPLQYGSFQKNTEMSAIATDFGVPSNINIH